MMGRKPQRFCENGHDKLLPHGSYAGGICAVCKRKLEKARYLANREKIRADYRAKHGQAN